MNISRPVLLMFFLSSSALIAASPSDDIKVGTITISPLKKEDINYGCGCSFHYPIQQKEKGVQILQWEEGEKASLRLNGSLERLDVVGATQTHRLKNRVSVGDRTVFSLAGPSVKVTADCTIMWICPPKSEGCEVTRYRARLEITSEKGNASIPAWGECGC
jgi:hypothetical protein